MDPRITFFPKRLVRLELTGWIPKMNREDEKRVRLDFTLPLLNEARDREMPGWMIPALSAMEAKDSVLDKIALNVELEGVTVEFWDTPKSPTRAELITAATLSEFHLEKVTRDKQTFPALKFSINIPRAGMLPFCDKYEAKYLWAEFTPVSAEHKTPPRPGVQMSIADAKPEETDKEQTPDEAKANAEQFFKKGGKNNSAVAKSIEEANEANKHNMEKAKAAEGRELAAAGHKPN